MLILTIAVLLAGLSAGAASSRRADAARRARGLLFTRTNPITL